MEPAEEFKCHICGRTFKYRRGLTRHLRAKHDVSVSYRPHGKKRHDAEDAKKAPPDDERVQCPICGDWMKKRSVTAHMNNYHPQAASNPMHGLVSVLEDEQSVHGMLVAAAKWLDEVGAIDPTLPPEVMRKLKMQDAKVQLSLRLVAAAATKRILKFQSKIEELDAYLVDKISPEWMEKEGFDKVLRLLERMKSTQESDFKMLQSISQLTQAQTGDTIDKLFGMVKAAFESEGSLSFQVQGVRLPKDANARLQVEQIMSQINLEDYVDYDDGDTIEAEAEEVGEGDQGAASESSARSA